MVIGSEVNIVYDSIQQLCVEKHNVLDLESTFPLNTLEKSSFKFKTIIISKCPRYHCS